MEQNYENNANLEITAKVYSTRLLYNKTASRIIAVMSNTLYRLTVVDITDMGISLLWMVYATGVFLSGKNAG